MRITQQYSVDPHAVRPGTSDALFARTIDATQRAPLVKAQEAVTAAVPRIIDSLPTPLLGGTLGLTVLAVMVASRRVPFRLAPALMSAMLLLPISNYHAAQPAQAQEPVVATEEERSSDRDDRRDRSRRIDWQDRSRDIEESEREDPPEVVEFPAPPNEFLIPPEITEGVVPLVEMIVPEEWTDEEKLRVLRRRAERLMEEIRRLRLEQHIAEGRRSLSQGLSQ